MDLELVNIKPDRTAPDTAFTAQMLLDGSPLLDINKKSEDHWPDISFHSKATNTDANWTKVEGFAKEQGHEHLYAYVNHLYATRQQEDAAEAAKKALDQKLRKLCLDFLVIKLPRHAEGEYMLSAGVKADLITEGKKKSTIMAAIGSETHKKQVRELFAEVMGEVFAAQIEFYNDRYAVSQTTLTLSQAA